jgi:spermidine synthase
MDTADRPAASDPARKPENVHVPDHQHARSEPSADRDIRVELLADLDRPGGWMLLVDGIPQSHVDLDDPRHLELEYMRRLGHLVDLVRPAGQPLRALHLGAGALTLARYLAATRPGSLQLGVEADLQVAELVRQRLPVADSAAQVDADRTTVLVADARAVLAGLDRDSFDLVVADVFAGARTPAHLTSAEFTAAAARVLAPSGVYAANIGDGPPLAHARGRVAAVRTVFRHVYVLAEAAVLRGRRFGNLVVAGSDQELDVAALIRRCAADPFPAKVLAGAEVENFVAGTEAITDATAKPSPAPPPGAFA